MANRKISNLPSVTTPSADSILPIVQSGTTSKITYDNLKTDITPIYDQYASGTFHSFNGVIVRQSGVIIGNQLIAKKIKIEQTVTITDVLLRYSINNGAGNSVIGIYEIENGLPTNLLGQTSEFILTVTTAQTISLSTPLVLEPGAYAVVYFASKDCSMYTNPYYWESWGYDSTMISSLAGAYYIYEAPLTYTSTLPSTFPVGTYRSASTPFILFQVS